MNTISFDLDGKRNTKFVMLLLFCYSINQFKNSFVRMLFGKLLNVVAEKLLVIMTL